MVTELSIPRSCLTQTWLLPSTGPQQLAGALLGNPADPLCWPGTRDLSTTFSPAICPSGYTSACDIDKQSRADASETVFACCPSNFICDPGTWSCVQHVGDGSPRTLSLTYSNNFGEITSTPVAVHGVNAHSIRVAFHASDKIDQSSLATDSSWSTAAAVPSLTSLLPTSVSSVAPPVTNPQGLPAGALVGIGVGSTLGAALLISVVFWLVRRRYRRKQQHPSAAISNSSELPSEAMLDPSELSAATKPLELSATRDVCELESKAYTDSDDNNSRIARGL